MSLLRHIGTYTHAYVPVSEMLQVLNNVMQLSKLLLTGYRFSSIRISIQCMVVVLPDVRLAFTHSKLRKWPFFDFKIQGGLGPLHPLRRPWCHCIFKTFHRCFVNIYRHGFKSLARIDLKSMHFVHVVTSILVNHSYFCWSCFCFNNANTWIRSYIFSLLTTVFYIYKGPLLSFSQGPHTTLICPWR